MIKKTVWVLGSSNIDTTYYVDELPQKGETIFAKSCLAGTGGKGANQAIAAAHFGSYVAFIGAIGDDEDGQALLNSLKSYHINTQHVHQIKKLKSGNAVIFVDNAGSNFISVFPGANQQIPLTSIHDGLFNRGDFLVAQLEVNLDVVEKAFLQAQKDQVTTILNPSPFKELSATLLENIDVLVMNETEGEMLAGIAIKDEQTAKNSALKIMENGVKNVVVTLGGDGAVWVSSDKAIYYPAHPVEVVDTQGAGDAFLGTMISQLYNDKSIEDAVSLANYVAAISVTREGSTQVCLPDLITLDLSSVNKGVVLS